MASISSNGSKVNINEQAVLNKQRQCLLLAVEEAKKMEDKRWDKLDRAQHPHEKAYLNARFTAERDHDRRKIENLLGDYTILKKAIDSGAYRETHSKYQAPPSSSNGSYKVSDKGIPKANRFAGLEDPIDIIFHKQVIERFELLDKNHDIRNRAASTQHRCGSSSSNTGKLELLNEKKAILKQLIGIEQQQQQQQQQQQKQYAPAAAVNNKLATKTLSRHNNNNSNNNNTRKMMLLGQTNGNYRSNTAGSASRSDDTRSVASWATFASRTSSSHARNTSSRPSNVPKLSLPISSS